jgi:hypothetical protein
MSVQAIAAGVVVATDLIKVGSELLVTFAKNPSMTSEQVAVEVEKTQTRAQATVMGWRAARANRASG